jgi:DNA repair exonuclease SbcCD ATPase subunit
MVIRKITLHHILTYYGDQSVELPTAGNRTLSVLVGPNNSGKTSIIRALKFWFYGKSGIAGKKDPSTYLSNRAKDETPVGKTLEGWVEITFERQGAKDKEILTLRRTIEAKRSGESRWELKSSELYFHKPGARIPMQSDDEDHYQRMIESMVPRVLFDAFYFKGEPLDGKLLGDVGSIREALGQFLHEDQWEEAEQAAADVRDRLGSKLSKLTAANSELQRKINDESQYEQMLDGQRKALEGEKETIRGLEARQAEETEKLEKLGDEQAARELKTKLAKAEQAHARAQSRFRTADDALLAEISGSQGIPFLAAAVKPVKKILSEMEDDNILPADITPGFVDRVLAKKACICGKAHDTESRSQWEAYKQKTLAADAGEGLRKLLDWVKPAGPLSIEARAHQIGKTVTSILEDRREAIRELNEAEGARKAARAEMELVPVEEIARIGRALNEIAADLKTRDSRLKTISNAVLGTELSLKKVRSEIQDLSKKGGINQKTFKQLSQAKDRADRLHRTLSECRNRLGQYFHRVLQASVSTIYDTKSTDGSKAHINRASLLPSIHVNGQATHELGGGQSQLLALAYVVSLARLRQSMHSQMEELGVRLGKIDDQSFFMDSPFGHMEEHYKKAAVELAPNCARQMVVFVWKEDWDFARPILENQADSIYAIEFLTTEDDLEKVVKPQRKYAFASGNRDLLVPLPRGESFPRSQLIKIK